MPGACKNISTVAFFPADKLLNFVNFRKADLPPLPAFGAVKARISTVRRADTAGDVADITIFLILIPFPLLSSGDVGVPASDLR